MSTLLAVSLATLGASTAAAYTGSGLINTGWSCPPDSQISMVFSVSGSGSGSYVDVIIDYHDIYGNTWYVEPPFMYSGIHTVHFARPARTVIWVYYQTFGNAVLNWVGKDCT